MQQWLGWSVANCSVLLLSLGNFCTPSLYKRGSRNLPRHGYHCGFSKGSPDWAWRSLSLFIHRRRASQVLCYIGLHVLLRLSISCHQVPDPKTATGPMFINVLLFFFFPVLEEKMSEPWAQPETWEAWACCGSLLSPGLQNQGRAAPGPGKPQSSPIINRGSGVFVLEASETAGK